MYALLTMGLQLLIHALLLVACSAGGRGGSSEYFSTLKLSAEVPAAATLSQSSTSAAIGGGGATVLLQNGFVRAELTLSPPSLCELRGDFSGSGHYGKNTLAAPFRLSATLGSGDADAGPATLVVVVNSSAAVWVRLLNVSASAHPLATETWDLRLARGSRALELNTTGSVVATPSTASYSAVLHTVGFSASSITGHFDKGVVQARGKGGTMQFASNSSLPRLYALGEGSSVEMNRGSVGTTGVVALRSGDVVPMQFGLGRAGPRRLLTWSTSSALTVTAAVPVPPPGFALVGVGNCLPDLPQWYSSNPNITLASCGAICSKATLCVGFDWSAGSCRVRFPLARCGLPPVGFTALAGSDAACGNLTAATVRREPPIEFCWSSAM